MTTTREKEAKRSLKRIGPHRLVAFLRSMRHITDPSCIELANRHLDEGEPIEWLIFTGQKYGFHLSVEPRTPLQFRVALSCVAGPTLGDGGTWDVLFNEDGTVQSSSLIDLVIY
jgi:hypothetical protein